MKLAAYLLFGPCQNVLVTDLGWPRYHAILEMEAKRVGRCLTVAPIRDGALAGWSENEVIDTIREAYRRGGCDGAFLCGVSNLGVRLPVTKILRALEAIRELRFVVVDGAQELNHLPTDLSQENCDLYITGSHKWLGGFHPMGIGYYGRRRSRGMIDTMLAELTAIGLIDDPLLQMSFRDETDHVGAATETISLIPLFSCHGAVADAACSKQFASSADTAMIATLAADSGWSPLLPAAEMRTAIMLLQSTHSTIRGHDPRVVWDHFGRQGVALTCYPAGVIRLSLSDDGMGPEEQTLLGRSLESASSI